MPRGGSSRGAGTRLALHLREAGEHMNVLVVFESDHGQADKVARRIAVVLRAQGHEVEIARASSAPMIARFGAVVVGGSIRMGKHQKALVDFCRKNRDALLGRPTAFFSVSVSARRRFGKAEDEIAKHLSRFIGEARWVPERLWPVAGALKYTQYRPHIRVMLKLIAKLTGGDTDTSRDWEYTDWDAVDALARGFAFALPRGSNDALPRGSANNAA
jgi:menaquinone-dependent protoporphyrinogen oxidase